MTRSVGDDGLIPEDPARSEIVDTANNLEIVTMYSFASKKNVRKLVLFLISRNGVCLKLRDVKVGCIGEVHTAAEFPGRMTLDLRGFDSESKERMASSKTK